MMKMYRRGEKRERKRGKGAEDSDASDASVTFDPREMRAQRYFIAPDFFLPLFFYFFILLSAGPSASLCLGSTQVSTTKPTNDFK